MEPTLVGLHDPVRKIEDMFIDGRNDPTQDYMNLTGNLFRGGMFQRIFGEQTGKSKQVDQGKRNFLTAPIRAMRAQESEVSERMPAKADFFESLFEDVNLNVDMSPGELLDWKSWFTGQLAGLDIHNIGAFIEKAGIGTVEGIKDLMQKKIDRRDFLQGASAAVAVGAIETTPLKFAKKVNPQKSPEGSTNSVEGHSKRISPVNLIASGVVASAFTGIIALQFAGKIEMSPKTSLIMSTAWTGKMLALHMDSIGIFGSSEEDKIASKAAFDHEIAELENLKVAFALTGAAEVASHLYLDRYYGSVNAEEIWANISNGERVMVPLNGGSEKIELTFADFEAWVNIEKASDISEERTELVKRIISGEELEEVGDEEVSGLIEEWIADRRVETTLDKYEDARYEKQLLRSRLAGEDQSTTVDKLNDPNTEHADDFRLAGHIRKWIKNRDENHDEISQVLITEDDLTLYLKSREDELASMSAEGLDEEIKKVEDQVRQGVWKMNAMAGMFAPFSLTFTSAGIVNGYMKEMAVKMYELDALRKLREDGLDTDYHESANKFSVNAMTSKWGLLHLMKATATNIQGAALYGDPPNIFYRKRYGDREWLKNSAIGFLLSGAITGLETNLFLRYAGLDLSEQHGLGFRESFRAAVNAGKSFLNTPLQAAAYINEKITGNKDNTTQKFAKAFFNVGAADYLNIDNKSLTSNLPGKASEMFYLDPFVKAFKGVTKGDILGGLREAFPDAVDDPKVRKVIDDMSPENFKSVEDMKVFILNNKLMDEAKLDEIIEGGHHDHKLSHAALDVRNALLTQLWAVGSLQVVVKKFMKLDQDIKPNKQEAMLKIGAILGTIAGISGIADNVAAMLFGIDVLEDIGRSALGEEEYENNKDFQESLRRWAFLTAVSAGCLTLIGNGPNMVLEVLESIYRNDETDVLDAITRKMKMGESAMNLQGPLSVAVTLGAGFSEIYYQLDKALGEKAE